MHDKRGSTDAKAKSSDYIDEFTKERVNFNPFEFTIFRPSVPRSVFWNATAASATFRGGLAIEVFLNCPERPLLPTALFVTSLPGIDFTNNPPCVICAVEDLILIRVPLGESDDYFIYRPGGKNGPSLKLLPWPRHIFFDQDVGLLRCGEEHYTIAVLIPNKPRIYHLHSFDSATEKWSIVDAPLVEPQVSFPYKRIPRNSERLLFHLTSTVIPIGGTMGWVDLRYGILLCDVLSREPKLRGVPLPLPLDHLRYNNGLGADLGCPRSLRGITVIASPGMEPCLKFVELGVSASPIIHGEDSDDDEDWEMHGWTITTWSNSKMTTSWKDWHKNRELKASCTTISSKLNSKMLKSGLLSPERAFQNLLVSNSALGIDGDIVYLQARVKFMDPQVFVLGLQTRDNKLLGAVEFATERTRNAEVWYFPSNISKYVNPETRDASIPKGTSLFP
ncbi:hypothetical protein BS78_06G090300 [Paspalum vaginatum]|nr:hypothetical protein BS78_06G090300 [Paspalum vaginatum]